MKDRKLPEGWRLSEEYSESKQAAYVKRVTEELSAIPRIKRPVPTTWQGKPIEELTQAEREEFHFSLQPESTKAALLAQKTRKPEDDMDHVLRPMPDCLANPEATTLDELTAKRNVDEIEVDLYRGMQRRSKNTIGQSDGISVDAEKRQRGIEAFTYSPPAKLTDEQFKKVKKLEEFEAIVPAFPTENEETKESLSFRASLWLKEKTGIWWW